jgi:1,4-dihydroxy-2-naphthoate octaprenyltransferase
MMEVPMKGNVVLGLIRAPFLMLTPCCVLVGMATAMHQAGTIRPMHAVFVVIGALAAHACVNAFNEYLDFRSGLDAKTARTPFSGGSGTLPLHPEAESKALATVIASAAVMACVGLYFCTVRGFGLMWAGIPGLAAVILYTPWATRHPMACLIAPGFGFGTCMVNGVHFALTGSYSWASLIASFVPFFLVSDLLLLNQFPDTEADRSVGRNHYPIAIGRRASAKLYAAFLVLAYVPIVIGAATGIFPGTALLGILTLPLAAGVIRGAMRNAENVPGLVPFMGLNVVINLATPVLLAAGIWMG